MTAVYKETVQSTYSILQKLGNHISTFSFIETENDTRILNYLSIAQYFSALGDEYLAKIVCDKVIFPKRFP